MTAKQIFEYALVELNKKDAPSLLLEDYNYFINKAINQYINKMYNAYDVNQQKTDDLRVLKSSAILTPSLSTEWSASNLLDKTYEVDLPVDYLHILNCVVEYTVLKNYKCYNNGSLWQQGAKRATADILSQLIHNYYLRPSYKNPYFYINNVTTSPYTIPTTDNQTDVQIAKYIITVDSSTLTLSSKINITLLNGTTIVIKSGDSDTATYLASKITTAIPSLTSAITVIGNDINILDSAVSAINLEGAGLYLSKDPSSTRIAEVRYGNKSKVKMEIRYGKDNSTFQLSKVYIDYLKSPQFIRLTQDEVDEVDDVSQILEFPDYVCQEIVNELVKLLMENSSDPRLQTNIPINQSIASPQAQGQQEPQRKK